MKIVKTTPKIKTAETTIIKEVVGSIENQSSFLTVKETISARNKEPNAPKRPIMMNSALRLPVTKGPTTSMAKRICATLLKNSARSFLASLVTSTIRKIITNGKRLVKDFGEQDFGEQGYQDIRGSGSGYQGIRKSDTHYPNSLISKSQSPDIQISRGLMGGLMFETRALLELGIEHDSSNNQRQKKSDGISGIKSKADGVHFNHPPLRQVK